MKMALGYCMQNQGFRKKIISIRIQMFLEQLIIKYISTKTKSLVAVNMF